ncbi:hypothetical protein [Streptomyces alfalfae]
MRRHDFLRATQWAVASGLWPRINATTLRIAHDLADRMNADGHVAYGRLAMARRLRVSRRTIDRHVAHLRDIGLLVWVVHGTRKNTRPPHLPGWAGTATIYAATVPPAWDTAMGHRISGTGYQARLVGFTAAGRKSAIAEAGRRSRTKSIRRDPPSCRGNHVLRKAKVRGGKTKTPKGRVTSGEAAAAVALAAWVRPRVPWLQSEGLRRLAFALRPWMACGFSREELVVEFTSWWLNWRPRSPAAYLMARWRARRKHGPSMPGPRSPAEAPGGGCAPPQAFLDAVAAIRSRQHVHRAAAPTAETLMGFEIRDRIRASLMQAALAHMQRPPERCSSLAEWERLLDERSRSRWTDPYAVAATETVEALTPLA